MDRITKHEALPRSAFHERLRNWLKYAQEGDTIGDGQEYGGQAWLWIKFLGNRYYLNADTNYEGVAGYLELLEENGEDMRWSVVENERGNRNKAAFGPDQVTISGFYLYRALSP